MRKKHSFRIEHEGSETIWKLKLVKSRYGSQSRHTILVQAKPTSKTNQCENLYGFLFLQYVQWNLTTVFSPFLSWKYNAPLDSFKREWTWGRNDFNFKSTHAIFKLRQGYPKCHERCDVTWLKIAASLVVQSYCCYKDSLMEVLETSPLKGSLSCFLFYQLSSPAAFSKLPSVTFCSLCYQPNYSEREISCASAFVQMRVASFIK